jgi:hypothetical protein
VARRQVPHLDGAVRRGGGQVAAAGIQGHVRHRGGVGLGGVGGRGGGVVVGG